MSISCLVKLAPLSKGWGVNLYTDHKVIDIYLYVRLVDNLEVYIESWNSKVKVKFNKNDVVSVVVESKGMHEKPYYSIKVTNFEVTRDSSYIRRVPFIN